MTERSLPAVDVVEPAAEVGDRALQRERDGIAVALVLDLSSSEDLHHQAQLVLARCQPRHVGFTSKWMPHAASKPRRSGVVIRASYRDTGAAVPRMCCTGSDGSSRPSIGCVTPRDVTIGERRASRTSRPLTPPSSRARSGP